MAQGNCYVVGAGDFYAEGLTPQPGDLVLAADGGYLHLARCGIVPDAVLGDFDSMEELPDHPNVIRLNRVKDDTDMLAALRLGLEKGYTDFRLYGGTGGRMDHTLANIQCLAWLAGQGARGTLYGDGWAVTALTDAALSFGAARRGFVSVFCHGDRAEGVTLTGLKYPLENATLTGQMPLGVSNEFTGVESSIAVEHGTLVVLYYLS